ncbi:hypothetical protein OUZ56_007640 [Daphnia magna]|uniref:Uncharacterized protein n=1 Tax=Daphnia magna TaxID=35525 RepID=A0ABR0AAJ6_9CRUS|nr:hypothetical protein OUZ56_007640 [Daphnia magna]
MYFKTSPFAPKSLCILVVQKHKCLTQTRHLTVQASSTSNTCVAYMRCAIRALCLYCVVSSVETKKEEKSKLIKKLPLNLSHNPRLLFSEGYEEE